MSHPDQPAWLKPHDPAAFAAAAEGVAAVKQGLAVSEAAAKALGQPAIRSAFIAELDAVGCDLRSSAQVVKDAQSAEKITPLTFKGELTGEHRQPDHDSRLKAARLNAEVRGELKDREAIQIFMGLTDEQLAGIAAGRIDPAAIAETAPRPAVIDVQPEPPPPAAP